MSDWQKTQYRAGPSPDPLADPMAGENLRLGVFLPLLIGGLVLATIALLAYWLLPL